MSRNTGYWIVTGFFCLALGASGLGYLSRAQIFVEGMNHLGYPLYLMTILGLAKVLGAIALLVPGRPLLKEWAYAGFTFNLLGATLSHAFAGDPLSHTARPAGVLLILAASYALRPASRRIT